MASKTEELLQELIDVSDPYRKARRAGEYESAMATSAIAGLVVRPTTVAAITFHNRAQSGGKSLIIDRLFSHCLVSSAVQTFFNLWYCMHPNDVVVIPVNSITTLRGSGDASGDDLGNVFVEVGRTVVNDGWFPCGREGTVSASGTTPQGTSEWEVDGRLVVPPGASMSLHVVSALTGDTFTSGASWYRTQL